MPKFLRVKKKGAETLQVEISTIKALEIEFDEELDEYCLMLFTEVTLFLLCSGTFDECHFLLNKLNDQLDIDIVDV